MSRNQYIVQHPSQLNALSTLPFIRRSGLGKIVITDSFEHADKRQMEKNLNKYYYACGCSTGAKALLIGLFIFGVLGLYGFINFDWTITKSLVSFFGGAILLSGLGKLIGLGIANGKLRKTIKEIQSVWKPGWQQPKTFHVVN